MHRPPLASFAVFSAVVINWNGKAYLEACLLSVLAQRPAPAEVILVDNHSDDGSREFVAEQFPSVSVLDTGSNRGPGPARNLGLTAARHELVLVLDNDVVLEEGVVAGLLESLAGDAEAAAVQARSVCFDQPEVVHYDRADLHPLGLYLLHNFFVPVAKATGGPARVGGLVSFCFLVRRPLVLAAGGFDEDLFFYFEDTDLAWRLRLMGHPVRICPAAVVRHRGGTPGLSQRAHGAYSSRRTYYHSRNRLLVVIKNLHLRTLLLTLPMQCAYETTSFCFALGKGHGLAWLRGKGALLMASRSLLRRRRQVQRQRQVRDRDLLVVRPLSMHPGLADRGPGAWLKFLLDGICAWNWRLVRWACG